jgi:hypothetical protein
MDGFVPGFPEFLLGDILLREISEGTMRIFGCILIFPWLIRLIVLLAEDASQLVFT